VAYTEEVAGSSLVPPTFMPPPVGVFVSLRAYAGVVMRFCCIRTGFICRYYCLITISMQFIRLPGVKPYLFHRILVTYKLWG
jgi:hypothetical protein